MRVTCLIGGETYYIRPDHAVKDAHLHVDAMGCQHHLDEYAREPAVHPGVFANMCDREHPGDCWAGPASGDRPEGCKVTRPLLLEPFGQIGLPEGTMTDQNRVNAIMQALFTSSTTFTITPGTGGGSAFTMTPPLFLRLMTANGTNTSNGTELAAGLGYTTGGSTMGSAAFGAPSAAVQTNSNSVSWTVTGAWSTVVGIEIWDSAATKLRWLFGALTSNITGASNGDTVQFAAASISISGAAW